MRTFRTLSLLPVALFALGAIAQDAVRITDIAQMVRKPDLAHDKSVRSGMQAAGVADDRIHEALTHGKATNLPAGLRTDSALAINAEMISNYRAHRVCTFTDEAGLQVLVQVLMEENHHMPNDLRSKEDIYLVFPEAALDMNIYENTRPKASPGPNWKRMPVAKINTPDGVYATYDLGSDDEVLEVLAKSGMSNAEIKAVVFRSHERNWPTGIDAFERRYPKLTEFKKYKAFKAAQWDDKVLLVIPSSLNKRRSIGTRPPVDIYMVYTKSAVSIKKKTSSTKFWQFWK